MHGRAGSRSPKQHQCRKTGIKLRHQSFNHIFWTMTKMKKDPPVHRRRKSSSRHQSKNQSQILNQEAPRKQTTTKDSKAPPTVLGIKEHQPRIRSDLHHSKKPDVRDPLNKLKTPLSKKQGPHYIPLTTVRPPHITHPFKHHSIDR